jgi:hypothetical protein
MSFRGAILICLLLLLLAGDAIAQALGEGLRLDFNFAISEESVVDKSKTMEKLGSAFVDTNGDGIYDQVKYDGADIEARVDIEDAQGFSFADGTKMAFYPTRLMWLPRPDTYEVIGFLHHWDEYRSNLVAVLAHQDKNYETSEGITIYVIDRAGVRVGSLFYSFMEKSFLRYTVPYQKWMQTGTDFAIGTSPTVSNYFLMGKDLGLVDNVLVINVSLSTAPMPTGQDFELRKPEMSVVQESLTRPDTWNAFSGPTGGGVFRTVRFDNEVITATIQPDKAHGFSFGNGRYAVFYPSTLNSLPTPPTKGINWELFGFVHYFDEDGKINALLAVLFGQLAGDETTFGMRVKFVDNAGIETGQPSYMFFPRRSVRNMSTYQYWEDAGTDFALGYSEAIKSKLYLVKDLGLVDKIFVISYPLY